MQMVCSGGDKPCGSVPDVMANGAQITTWRIRQAKIRHHEAVEIDCKSTKEFLLQPVKVHKQVLTGRWPMGVHIESGGTQVMSRLYLFETICRWFVSDVLKKPNIKEVEHCCQVIEHEGLVELNYAYTQHVLYKSAIGDCIGLYAKDDLTPELRKHIWKEGGEGEVVAACYSGIGCASNLIKDPPKSWICDCLVDAKFNYSDMTWPLTRRVVECVDRVNAYRRWLVHHHSGTPEEIDGLRRLMAGHFKELSCKDGTIVLNPGKWLKAYEHQGGCTMLYQYKHSKVCEDGSKNNQALVGTDMSHCVLGLGVMNITWKEHAESRVFCNMYAKSCQ
jgi:hypothetical protein